MLSDQTLAEDNHVIVVNQPLVAQSGLLSLGPGRRVPPRYAKRRYFGDCTERRCRPRSITLTRMVLAEKRISSLLQQPITDSLSGHRKWGRDVGEAGQASIRHQEMTQTEPMDRTNERLGAC